MSDFKTYVNHDSMIMGDLEGCMQLGVATSPYRVRLVTKILCNALISTSMGLQFLLEMGDASIACIEYYL